MVANMRVNTTMSVVFTPEPMVSSNCRGCLCTDTGVSSCIFSLASTAAGSSASMTPVLISPARPRASHTNAVTDAGPWPRRRCPRPTR